MGRIFFHIGRNKCGSTTLQDFFSANKAALDQHHITFGVHDHLRSIYPKELGFARAADLVDFSRSNPERTLLVSNEAMSAVSEGITRSAIGQLEGADVTLLIYIRDYAQWLVSDYTQNVKTGAFAGDFDAFFEAMRERISLWPLLKLWGEGIGWNKVRIRSLNKSALQGGDLIEDCLSALGLDQLPGAVRPARNANESPHWMEIEFTRLLIEKPSEDGWGGRTGLLEILTEAMRHAIARSLNREKDHRYVTRAQAQWLAELYNHDVARIADATGFRVPPALPLPEIERPFLPDARHIPGDIWAAFAARVRSAQFVREEPTFAEAADRVMEHLFLGAA